MLERILQVLVRLCEIIELFLFHWCWVKLCAFCSEPFSPLSTCAHTRTLTYRRPRSHTGKLYLLRGAQGLKDIVKQQLISGFNRLILPRWPLAECRWTRRSCWENRHTKTKWRLRVVPTLSAETWHSSSCWRFEDLLSINFLFFWHFHEEKCYIRRTCGLSTFSSQ